MPLTHHISISVQALTPKLNPSLISKICDLNRAHSQKACIKFRIVCTCMFQANGFFVVVRM